MTERWAPLTNNMLILVEGVDGSGKSTLVRKLAELGYTTLYPPRCITDPFQLYTNAIFSKSSIIFDRSFVSDMVYRLQDNEKPDKIDLAMAAQILNSCKVIHCDTKYSYRNSIERGEDNITSEVQHKLIKEYYNVILTLFNKFTKVKIFKYDFTKVKIEEVIKFIEGGNV